MRPERFALLIGAMKSGTTSLFDLLASHPQICGSFNKEPSYFHHTSSANGGPDGADARYFRLWRAWDAARHRVALEASTAYTRVQRRGGTPERVESFVARSGADVRFLYLMRDPVERLESHLRHVAYGRPRRLLIERKHFINDAILTSSYAFQLDPWVARFGRERVLLLSFEELRSDPQALLRRVCVFLDVDPEHAFVRTDEARNVSMPMHPIASALTRSSFAKRALERLPPRVRAGFVALVDRLGEDPRPLLRPAERQDAIRRLMPDVERLRSDYGFDTSVWPISRAG